jgi:O-antigen/teichoic acid export membrane protein
LEREGRFREISLITTASNVINSGATIVLAVLGFKYISLAYASVISAACMSVMFIIVGRRHFSCYLGIAEWSRVANFGVQMIVASSVVTLSQRLSEIFLGRILGLGALGLYNRAGGLSNMLWGNIHWLASRIVLVDLANLHRAGVPLRDRYLTTAAIMTAILWPAFAGLGVVAKPLIFLVYGEQWVSAALPLTYLAIASIILVTITMASEVFTVTGNLRVQTRVEVIRAPISLALFAGGCLISLEAAALSRIIDAMIAFALYRRQLNRVTGTRFKDLKRHYVQGVLLTLAATAPAGILILSSSKGLPSVLPLTIAILMGVALWTGTLFVLRHPLATEVMISARGRLLWTRRAFL